MRHLLLFSVLLFGVTWAAAQSDSGQSASGKSGGQATVQGCLSSSGGTYTLTTKNGKTYQLAGDTAKLADHVGHEIKVTGTASESTASSGDAMGKSDAGQTLEVSTFKHISKTCGGGGSSY